MKRKLFAVLLAVLMVLSLLPAVFAPETAVAEVETHALDSVQGGAILHCFDWSYKEIEAALPDIAAAGYVAVQTSPVQQPKDYNSAWTGGDQWWKLYQPLGFTIADGDTWLGTKQDLKDLCDAAEDCGIYVIVDVVANHLANKTGGGGWAQVNPEIDPELYYEEYFHSNTAGVGDGSRYEMTQNQMGMPDLNTGNEFVQQKVYNLLVECVDCGVDGFRFDAAKHIELPNDPGCGSDFWSAILNGVDNDGDIMGIRNYAGAENLFIYGESLSGNKTENWVMEYATYMALTDSDYGGRMRNAVTGMNAGMLGDGSYIRCDSPSSNVVWVESHDTYEDGGSVGLTPEQIKRAWAIVGARADSTALFLARPNETMGLASSDTTWKSDEVAAVNNFKKHFDGKTEYLGSDYNNKLAWIERGGNGIVISKLDGQGSVSVPVHQMADGTYRDQLTNNPFTVSNGKIRGIVGSSGIAVVYNADEEAADANPDLPSGDYIQASMLYLVPNANWKSDNARFAMYVFDGNGHEAWVDMTDADGDGVYEAQVPGTYFWTAVIFCRMNGGTTENSWSNKWNQTSNLVPPSGSNVYTITNNNDWDGDIGIWSNSYQGYYLVGNMNGWAVNQNYKLTRNASADAEEYSIGNIDLTTYSRFKVVYSEDGSSIQTWYPDGAGNNYGDGNNRIAQNGSYSLYFRPNGNNGWNSDNTSPCHYIYVQMNSSSSSENEGFFLVGSMTNWKVDSRYRFTPAAADNEYTIDIKLNPNDQFKAVYSADGENVSIWFPDPGDNYGANDKDENSTITEAGIYTVSFNSVYGRSDWYTGCILCELDTPIYTVKLLSGEGTGEPIYYCSDEGTIAETFQDAQNCQFYYEDNGSIGFCLYSFYCPDSFTAPQGKAFKEWNVTSRYIVLDDPVTSITALWETVYAITYTPIDPAIAAWSDRNPAYAAEGNYVDFNIGFAEGAYEAGYRLEKIIATTAEGATEEITTDMGGTPLSSENAIGQSGDGKKVYGIAYTMPASAVTFEAVWIAPYTVQFSVPNGVTAPGAISCKAGESITLPDAGAPEGYVFVGWVTEDYDNVDERPDALSGSYTPTANITLKALYSRTESFAAGGALVTAAPDDWSGSYVITYGKTDTLYALKGLAGTRKYESVSAGGAVAFADTGMTLDGEVLTGAADAYVFTIEAKDGKFTIRNAETGTYLASRGGYLMSYKTDAASYDRWSLAVNGTAAEATNGASRTIPYLAFSAKGYFMIGRTADPEICFWKLAEAHETTTYTTIIH